MSRSRDRVERRRRLVEDEDPGVLQQHPGDRDPLLLAARELVAALADDRLVARGQLQDALVDRRRAGRRLQLRLGRLRPGVAQVVADRGVEEVRLLGDDADRAPEGRQRDPPDVDAVDLDGAAVDVVEARHEVGRRRLARARRADERDELARLGLEVDLLEGERGEAGAARARRGASAARSASAPAALGGRRPPRDASRLGQARLERLLGDRLDDGVGHRLVGRGPGRVRAARLRDRLERPRRRHGGGRDSGTRPGRNRTRPRTAAGSRVTASGRVDDLRVEVEVLEDPVEERERPGDLDLDVEQLARAGRRAGSGAW